MDCGYGNRICVQATGSPVAIESAARRRHRPGRRGGMRVWTASVTNTSAVTVCGHRSDRQRDGRDARSSTRCSPGTFPTSLAPGQSVDIRGARQVAVADRAHALRCGSPHARNPRSRSHRHAHADLRHADHVPNRPHARRRLARDRQANAQDLPLVRRQEVGATTTSTQDHRHRLRRHADHAGPTHLLSRGLLGRRRPGPGHRASGCSRRRVLANGAPQPPPERARQALVRRVRAHRRRSAVSSSKQVTVFAEKKIGRRWVRKVKAHHHRGRKRRLQEVTQAHVARHVARARLPRRASATRSTGRSRVR